MFYEYSNISSESFYCFVNLAEEYYYVFPRAYKVIEHFNSMGLQNPSMASISCVLVSSCLF